MRIFLIISVFAWSSAQQDLQRLEEDVRNLPEKRPVKRHYVCPPNFVRLSHRCYFFSKEDATWQEAFYECLGMHSNLAIIKNSNQDKLIRRTLNQKTLTPLERWLGGQYDWKQMQWKWSASGKPVTFNGFQSLRNEDKEQLKWHCIVVDPSLQYRWSTRSCLDRKHFICQTKIKTVTNKGKRKLQKQFNANKYNKLNEIPVPDLPTAYTNSSQLKDVPINFKFEVNNELMDADYAYKPKSKKKKNKNDKKRRKNKKKGTSSNPTSNRGRQVDHLEEPAVLAYDGWSRRRRNKAKEDSPPSMGKDTPIQHIRWRTYKKEGNREHPLYPEPIVEEFNYVKE